MEHAHRSRGAIAVAGNFTVRRVLGDDAADQEMAEADTSILDDRKVAEECAASASRYCGADPKDVLASFADEVDELLAHTSVRDAVDRVAAALLSSPTASLTPAELDAAFQPPPPGS